jgi:hypothetical protein
MRGFGKTKNDDFIYQLDVGFQNGLPFFLKNLLFANKAAVNYDNL